MRRLKKVNPARPLLQRSDEGGPLLRELTSLRLIRLVDFINHTAARAFPRVSGLSGFEWRAVALACGTPLLSINELAARLHRGAGQVSRTVKKLVAAGLLHRASRTGGPGVLISPTPLGRTVYGPLEQLARERNAALIAGLSADELKVLDRCISVMTANAMALLAHEEQLQGSYVETPP